MSPSLLNLKGGVSNYVMVMEVNRHPRMKLEATSGKFLIACEVRVHADRASVADIITSGKYGHKSDIFLGWN
jgi:hypothetical protein